MNKKIRFFFLAALILEFASFKVGIAQDVRGLQDQSLPFAWAGGLHSCQFGEIDLNGNGVTDLFVFDSHGNRVLTFLNDGIPGEISYTYAPEFALRFPKMKDWAILADYDGDGKADIFTYSPGWAGMQVYRNVSEDQLTFERVVYPFLPFQAGAQPINIFVTNADYPAIVDLDGDGDLDILTFWVLGGFVEAFTNRSIDLYGHRDSLHFVKTEFCWGRIAENEENNTIYLDTCLFKQAGERQLSGFRHVGSTMRVMDLNNNGLPDLILGDVDYPNLIQLTNGGTVENAIIVSQDTAFPSYDVPVRLFSMPVTALVDVNNNGLKDLIVSPFDPSPIVSESLNNVWLYLNEGTAEQPIFRLHTKNFLQDQMIDLGTAAYPLFFDINGNGLTDMLVGNYGYYKYSWYEAGMLKSRYVSQLAYFENIGEPGQAVYQLMDRDFAGLSALGLIGLVSAMADVSGNGFPDLLVGSENGKLIFVEQVSSGNWAIRDQAFGNISVGAYSAPQLYDIDGDGITDLVVGARNGKIGFYKGSLNGQELVFDFVTDALGGVNVTDFNISWDGYSTPHFFRKGDGELLLLVGSEQGKLFLFDQIGANIPHGTFREADYLGALLDTTMTEFDLGMRTAAAITDLHGDGRLTMVAGNYGGGLQLFNGVAEVKPGILPQSIENQVLIYPNPSEGLFKLTFNNPLKAKLDVFVYNTTGQQLHHESIPEGEIVTNLNLRHLPRGMYILHIFNDKFHLVKKIIIEE